MKIKFNRKAVKFLEKLDDRRKKIQGFGRIRVISRVDKIRGELLIYDIDFRGDAYK